MARSPWTLFPCKIANRVERKKGKNRINKLNQLRKISKVYTRKGNFSQKSKLLPLLINENSGRIFTTFLRNYSATLFLFSFVQKSLGRKEKGFLHVSNRGKRFLSRAGRKRGRRLGVRWRIIEFTRHKDDGIQVGGAASKFESRCWDFFSLIDHARFFPPPSSSCNRFHRCRYFYTFPFLLYYILYPFFVTRTRANFLSLPC